MPFAIQDWNSTNNFKIYDTIPTWYKGFYNHHKILTVIQNGKLINPFTSLIVQPKDLSFYLIFDNKNIGKIPDTVVKNFKLLNTNILAVQTIAHYQNQTYIEITYA